LVLAVDVPLHTAAVLLRDTDIGGAPVVDRDGRLVGVISRRDLFDALLIPAIRCQEPRAVHRWWQLRVGQFCSSPARTTTPGTPAREAALTLLRHHISRLVVVDGDEIVGMVTGRDLLAAV
jgi:acetoin utilization protein AcuB